MKIRKLGIYFVVVLLMVSFVFSGLDMNVYAETKKIGIGNLTENDLVAAWYFDEDSGDVVKDYKGNYDGTANGTTIIDTPYGKCRDFDGVDDFIQFDNAIIPVGEKSIRFKIKLNSKPQDIGDSKYWYSVFDTMSYAYHTKGVGSIVNSYGHLWSFGGAAQGENFIYNVGGKDISDGQWHDVIFTWNGTTDEDEVKIYIDDMIIPFATATSLASSEGLNENNLMIGKSYSTDPTVQLFHGSIDEIEIYNKTYVPPTAPTNLTATAGNAKVDLSWGSVTDADGYNVKRSLTTGGPYTTVAQEVYGTTYTDTGLENGTTYYYVVSAVLNGVESENSNEASATPEGGSSSGDRALLRITMSDGTINEYDLSIGDINNFINWCDNRNKPYYIIEKDYNIKPFESRKDYIIFEKISQFEVMEYKN